MSDTLFFSAKFPSLTELQKGPKPKTNPRNINKSRHRQKEAQSIPKNSTHSNTKKLQTQTHKKDEQSKRSYATPVFSKFQSGLKGKTSQGEPKKVGDKPKKVRFWPARAALKCAARWTQRIFAKKNKKGEGEGVRPRSQIPETQAKPNELKEFLAEHIETHIQSQAATVTEITFRAGVQ